MNNVIEHEGGTGAVQGEPWKVGNLSAGEARMEVSNAWFSRPDDQKFISLSSLLTYTRGRYERATEARFPNKQIEFLHPEIRTLEDTHKLTFGMPDGTEVAPSNWAFGQTARLAGAPAGYLATLPSPLVADNLTYGMRHNRETEEIKTYYHKDGDRELMAATGPDYGRIPDFEVVEALMQIAGNGTGDMDWKVPGVMDWRTHLYDPNVPVSKETTTLFASDRDLFCFLVDDRNPVEVGKLPDGSPDLMFRGFYVKNSEVGAGTLSLSAMYLRAICCNRILWGVENFQTVSIRHSKHAPARFMQEIRPALEDFSNGSVIDLQAAVEKAKAARVAEDDDAALAWLKGRDLNKKTAHAVLRAVEKEEGHPARSAWDMAQGITAVAREIPNADRRLEAEKVAGRILDKVAA
jgi:hypothetical protein